MQEAKIESWATEKFGKVKLISVDLNFVQIEVKKAMFDNRITEGLKGDG